MKLMHTDWQGVGQIIIKDDDTVARSIWENDAPSAYQDLPDATLIKDGDNILQIMDGDTVLGNLTGGGQEWNAEVTYYPGDTVTFNDVEYEALSDVAKGIAPDDVFDGDTGGWKPYGEGED